MSHDADGDEGEKPICSARQELDSSMPSSMTLSRCTSMFMPAPPSQLIATAVPVPGPVTAQISLWPPHATRVASRCPGVTLDWTPLSLLLCAHLLTRSSLLTEHPWPSFCCLGEVWLSVSRGLRVIFPGGALQLASNGRSDAPF